MNAYPKLEALPYQQQLARFLQESEPAMWTWFSGEKAANKIQDATRLELLKTTVRLDSATYNTLYAVGTKVLERLELTLPLTFYQATNDTGQANAMLWYLPGEAHIVFFGNVLQRLNEAELTVLIGHELSHYKLWQEDDQRFFTTGQLLAINAQHPEATPSHLLDVQRFQLYTEVYADRGGLIASGDLNTAITCLVKMQTDLTEVNPQAYIEQAEEIFCLATAGTEGLSHPEIFIRVRALAHWANLRDDVDSELQKMIAGPIALTQLDSLAQQEMTQLTLTFLDWLLQPQWIQSQVMLAHARLFEPDHILATQPDITAIKQNVAATIPQLTDYWCYLILDFAASDAEIKDESMARGLKIAMELNIVERLQALAKTELKYTQTKLKQLQQHNDK